jgi:uncharacterized membrane protein
MKTIAQQLNVKEFPFVIKDSQGNRIYFEDSEGYWSKREYDSHGNQIYYEDSNGYWSKSEYDDNGREIYFEDSDGKAFDNRPKSREDKPVYKTVIEIDGAKYLLTKI